MKAAKLFTFFLVGIALGVCIALIFPSHQSNQTIVYRSNISGKSANAVSALYDSTINGIVDIRAVQTVESNGPLGTQSSAQGDEGAGVVFDTRGDIVTDEHVVGNAKKVTVTFNNGTTATAKVLGEDASTDVAVVRLETIPPKLTILSFDTSGKVQIGDPLIAIGSPFSLPGTVTSGIVSQVGRTITAPNGYGIAGAIQTDAPINPGNSGGPLINNGGKVIGLADQIESSVDQSSGVGFAIPASSVVKVADTIISGKAVEHAYVGISLAPTTRLAVIAKVVTGGPAAKAGLKAGDTITSLNGIHIANDEGLISTIGELTPGQKVKITYRSKAKTTTSELILANQPTRTATNS